MNKRCYKIGIIGGGASGLFFSYLVKKKLGQTVDVTIFEKNNKVGKKILATGNGKCNLSNVNLERGMYNSSFGEKVVAEISQKEVLDVFKDLKIITKTDSEGRIYPISLTANSVLDALYNANLEVGNNIVCCHEVKDLRYENGVFLIDEEPYDYCIMACGGLASVSYSDLIAKKLTNFGHKWVKDEPGLCSLITYEDTSSLNGLKVKAKVSINGRSFNGEVLFKKNGLSGIAIFEASRYVKKGDYISLDLMPDYDISSLTNIIKDMDTLNYSFPKMIARDILKRANGNLQLALKVIKDYQFQIKSKAGYENAQVMMGGIDTNDLNDSLESKIIPHLYVIGEVANVDGTCGGYNLHYAWASSIKASDAIAKELKWKLSLLAMPMVI